MLPINYRSTQPQLPELPAALISFTCGSVKRQSVNDTIAPQMWVPNTVINVVPPKITLLTNLTSQVGPLQGPLPSSLYNQSSVKADNHSF